MIIFFLFLSFDCYGLVLGVTQLSKNFFDSLLKRKNYSIGLVANQTSRLDKNKSSLDFLIEKEIPISKLFAPEHGYYGTMKASLTIVNTIEKKTGLPIISLYDPKKTKIIDPKIFDQLDALIFDLQDIGMRHYTYISVLYRIMESLVGTTLFLIVCDRPNPLGGMMEGPLVDQGLQSYISITSIPLKHGMTIGELALYFNQRYFDNKVLLSVIPLKKYKRKFSEYMFLAPLSININNKQSIYGYSFLGLVGEIKPFDVGVGRKEAFTLLALPEGYIDKKIWSLIEDLLNHNGIKTTFVIYYNNELKKKYEGFSLVINDPTKIDTTNLVTSLVFLLQDNKIKISYGPYANHVFGRQFFQEEKIQLSYNRIANDLKKFYSTAKNCFLYKPWPQVRSVSALSNHYCK